MLALRTNHYLISKIGAASAKFLARKLSGRHIFARYSTIATAMLTLVVCVGVTSCTSCEGTGSEDSPEPCPEARTTTGEAHDIALARCMLSTEPSVPDLATGTIPSLKLYVDLSGSMRSFLDPEYVRDTTHYRAILDELIAVLRPEEAYGFGNEVVGVRPTMGVLGNRNTYSHNYTRMEHALTLAQSDTALEASHMIIGDGRRDTPDAANDQYTRMRQSVEDWVSVGGDSCSQ